MNHFLGRPDGAAVDAEGCYWICANDAGLIHRFTPDGRLDRSLAVPVKKPTMCAFGGSRLDTLFVTSIRPGDDHDEQSLAGGVFALNPGVKGLPEPLFNDLTVTRLCCIAAPLNTTKTTTLEFTPMDFKRTLLVAALPLVFYLQRRSGAGNQIRRHSPCRLPDRRGRRKHGQDPGKDSNGELTFKMFAGGVLGSEKEVIEQAQVGAIQMARVSLGIVGPVVPDVNVFNMPFVFRDQAHMRKVIDGEIGDEILDKITNSEFNLVALAWMDGGTRNLYTKKPVASSPTSKA